MGKVNMSGVVPKLTKPGAGVPSAYTEIAYIESSGSQYINTGIIGKSGIDMECEVAWLDISGDLAAVSSRSGSVRFYPLHYYNGFAYGYNGFQSISGQTATVNQKYRIASHLYAGSQTVTVDGTTVATATTASSYNTGIPMFVFAMNYDGTANYFSKLKLYRLKLWENGTLVRDYVPARRKSDGVAGLYDLVGKTFYTDAAGVGFIAGPSVDLPDGYVALDFIQSTGTQYIDTGFKANQNTRIVMDVEPTNNGVDSWFFDGRHAANNNSFGLYVQYTLNPNAWYSDYGSSRKKFSGVPATERFTIDFNKTKATVAGMAVTHSASTFQSNYNLCLLCVNTAGSRKGYLVGKLYSCRMYDNGTLIRDFVPAKRSSDGKIGLYDCVNGVFYADSAGGNFTAGPVRDLPSGYAELHYIQSSGTQYIDTGFKPKYNTRLVTTISGFVSGQWKKVYGCRAAASATAAQQYCFGQIGTAGTLRLDYFGSNKSATPGDISKRTIIDNNKNVLTAYGTTFTCTAKTSGEVPYTLKLFAYDNVGEITDFGSFKMYGCKIYDNGVMVRCFVPCMSDTEGIGLYDKVNGVFYKNAGTGVFLGAEVAA